MRATAKPLSSSPMRVETANIVETADLLDAVSSLSPEFSFTPSSFDNPPKPNTSHQYTKLVRHTRKFSRRRSSGEYHSSRRREWKNAGENPSNGEVTADGAVGLSSSGVSEGELLIPTKLIKNALRIKHNNRNNNSKGSKNICSSPRHRHRHRRHRSLTKPNSSTCHPHPSTDNPSHLFPFSSTSSSSTPFVSAASSTSVPSATPPEKSFWRPCLPKTTFPEVPPVTRVVHRTAQTRVPRTLSANVQTSKCRLITEAVQTDIFEQSPHPSFSQNGDKLPTAVVVLTSTTGAQTSPSSFPSELAHHHNVVAEGLERIAVLLGQAPQEKEGTKTFPLVLPAIGEANSQEGLQFLKVQRRLEEVVQLAEERHVVRMQMEHRFDEMHSKLRRSEAESEATRQNLLRVHQTEIEMLEQRWNNESLKLFREHSTREAFLQKEKTQLTTTLEATRAALQWQRQQAIQTRECQLMQHEEQLQQLLCTYTLQVRDIEEERNALQERLQTQLKLTSEKEAQNKCLQLSLGSEQISCQQAIGQLRRLTEELDLAKCFANSTSEKAAMFESALQREETNHQAIRIATSHFVDAHRKHVSQLQETLQKAVARFVDLKAQQQQQLLQIPFHHCQCSLDHFQVQHSLRRHHDNQHQQHKGNDDLHQCRSVVLLPTKKPQLPKQSTQREEEEQEKVQRPKKACEKSPRDLPIIHHSETSSAKKVNSNKQCFPTGRCHKTNNDNDNNRQTTINSNDSSLITQIVRIDETNWRGYSRDVTENDGENTSGNVNVLQPSSCVCDGISSHSQSRFTNVSCMTCREEKTENIMQSREKAKKECFHSKDNNGFSSKPFSTWRMPARSTHITTSHIQTKNNESNIPTKSSTATAPPPPQKKNDTKKKASSSNCSSRVISGDSSASNNTNGLSCNHAENSNEENLRTSSITATKKAIEAPPGGVLSSFGEFCATVASRTAGEKKFLRVNANNYDYDDVFASIGVTDVSDIFRDINVECSSL